MSLSATVQLIDVFFIVFGQQWSSMAQRNKTYQAVIHTQMLVDTFTVDFVDNKTIRKIQNISRLILLTFSVQT